MHTKNRQKNWKTHVESRVAPITRNRGCQSNSGILDWSLRFLTETPKWTFLRMQSVAAPAFLSGEAKKFVGEQVYMVANSAFSQRGTHTPFLTASQVPLLSLDLSFPLCFLWFLSFPSLFHSHFPPLLSFHTARGSGGAL